MSEPVLTESTSPPTEDVRARITWSRTFNAPPTEPKTIFESFQHGTANALMERFRLDAEIASGGHTLLRLLLARMKQGEVAKALGVLPSNLSAMAAGRRPIPDGVLFKLCEMKVKTQ